MPNPRPCQRRSPALTRQLIHLAPPFVVALCAACFGAFSVGCARDKPQPEAQDSAPAPASGWPELGPLNSAPLSHIGQRVQTPSYALTAERASLCPEQSYFPAATGRLRIGVEVSVENTGSKPLIVNPFYAEMRDDAEYSYSFTLAGCEPALEAGFMAPGAQRRGWLSFDVRPNAVGLELRYSPLRGDAQPGPVVRFAVGGAPELRRGPTAAVSGD